MSLFLTEFESCVVLCVVCCVLCVMCYVLCVMCVVLCCVVCCSVPVLVSAGSSLSRALVENYVTLSALAAHSDGIAALQHEIALLKKVCEIVFFFWFIGCLWLVGWLVGWLIDCCCFGLLLLG